MKYLQVFISAENKEQATSILDSLLAKRLILGGPIFEGPAKFWWKEKIVEMGYCYIFTYTKDRFKDAIIEDVRKTTAEKVPMISFIPFEGNAELNRLIDETLI